MSKNTANVEQISLPGERGDPLRLQTFLYSKQLQIIFIIYRRPCDTVRVKNRPKLDLTALLRYMKADVNVTSFLRPAFSAHVSRQGMEKYNNFPL